MQAADAPPALRGRIGVLGHDLFLYPELTARENLAFFAGLYGRRDADDAARARARARRSRRSRRRSRVSSFSRGMRQRVALERALIHDPRLVLLDEPFTGLDEASTAALVTRLRGLRESGAAIVILATHDLDVAEGLLDEAVFLRDGRMVGLALAARRPARRRTGGDDGAELIVIRASAWLILRKDLTVEVRSGEIAYTTLFFAVSCVLVFAFALVREGRGPEDGAAGMLWIAVDVRRHAGAGPDVRARAPVRDAARAAAGARRRGRRSMSASCSGSSRCWSAPSSCSCRWWRFCSRRALLAHPFWLAAIMSPARSGSPRSGTLFAAMLVRARSRDVLLPVLLYPITVPVIIAGVRGTAALLQPELDVGIVRFWFALLVTFDVVFVTLALWTFEAGDDRLELL